MVNGLPRDFVAPANYVIRIQGTLDPGWSERLGGMRITTGGSGRHAATVLIGQLVDEAALLGVLNALYELGFPLLSVERVPPP